MTKGLFKYYAIIGLDGSEKDQKPAYIIFEWSIRDHSSITSAKRWVG